MGYIPIVVALLAFLLLLSLVNLTSIRSRQQAVGLALFQICQTARSRRLLLNMLTDVGQNAIDYPTLPPNHKLLPHAIPQMSPFLIAERNSVNELEFKLKEKKFARDNARLIPPLQVLNQRQYINYQIFERKVREYNRLLDSAPTSLVASLFLIKPIKLSSDRI